MRTCKVYRIAILLSCVGGLLLAEPPTTPSSAKVPAAAETVASAPAGRPWPWCNEKQVTPGIDLVVRLEKPTFKRHERIPFSLSVRNHRSGPIALATPLTFGQVFFARLEDDEGPVPASGSMVGTVPGKDRILGPGESASVSRDLLRLENLDFSPLPVGTYRLTVCYINPRADTVTREGVPKPTSIFRPQYLASRIAEFRIDE